MALIELENVNQFYGKVHALRDASLTVAPGPIGLIGQNGAGKSTLLKILLGLIKPSSGTGTVLGRDIRGDGAELRTRVGYMPEAESFVPGLRGVDLVALAGELSGMPRKQALRRAHEVLSYLGLEEARYRKCEQYSVGMKQRLKLATALVHDPELLLLDEPTAGMGHEDVSRVKDLIRTVAADRTVLMVEHNMSVVSDLCDRISVLQRGKVIAEGNYEEVSSNAQVMEAYMGVAHG